MISHLLHRLKFYWSINWTKTLYFNFKMFPFVTAKKLPVFFYGSVSLQSLKGKISIDGPIRRGMIGFGQRYEIINRSKGTATLYLDGEIKCKGSFQFGIDYFVYVAESAYLELGDVSSLGNNGKIVCYHKIIIGDFARIGYESQVIDSTLHQMINTKTGEKYPMTSAIRIGCYNYIGNRSSLMSNTTTPDRCTITSNSVCNKDYTSIGPNAMIGGVPAKLIRENVSRDWEGEAEKMKKWLSVF